MKLSFWLPLLCLLFCCCQLGGVLLQRLIEATVNVGVELGQDLNDFDAACGEHVDVRPHRHIEP